MQDIISSLGSNPVVMGGLLFAIAGFVIAYLRKIPSHIYTFIKRRCTVTLDIQDKDESYKWVSLWLSKNQKKMRDVSAVTRYKNKLRGDEEDEDFSSKAKDNRPKIFFTPAPGLHFFWFNRRIMMVYRKRKDGSDTKGGILESLGSIMATEDFYITFFSRNHELPKLLLEEARDVALPRDDKIEVRVSQARYYGYWTLIDRIRPRAIESVILANDQHLTILDDITKFLDSYQWYKNLGIPYRRGYLLYGSPGSGKTSFCTAIASSLKMNIYFLALQASGMTDMILVDLLTCISSNSIILMEDVDCAFEQRDKKSEDLKDKLTFSGLLNALDGVGGKDGRIIFMTTNHKEKLDPALIRPGRIDIQVELANAVKSQVQKLFERFYKDVPCDKEIYDKFVDAIPDGKHSMAKLQGHLMKYKENPAFALDNIKELEEEVVVIAPSIVQVSPYFNTDFAR